MSKLYDMYLELKKQDSKKIYLFKSGAFFIALEQDANYLAETFKFKLSQFNKSTLKCGFPCTSFDKYSHLFKLLNLDVQIVDVNKHLSYMPREYLQNNSVIELLHEIKNVDTTKLSITEAYQFIDSLKEKVENIDAKESEVEG